MPALKPSSFSGRVIWLGSVAPDAQVTSTPRARLGFGFAGPEGDRHAGLTRPACTRVAALHPKGTRIRNTRQVSILSAEELAEIAARMGLARVDPAWLGATMVLDGVPGLSRLPPSSRLQEPGGTTLAVHMENRACVLPARVIDAQAGERGNGVTFQIAARGRRGVTAWVERPGTLKLDDPLRLFVPDQPVWPHLPVVRR